MIKYRFCALLLLVLTISYGQDLISGTVVDVQTKEQLAFANIIINNKASIIADINGSFSFQMPSDVTSLTCSYVGYQKKAIHVRKSSKSVVIELTPLENNLKEIIIQLKENPANAIIRKVIAHKEKNNPENLSSFQYASYNKTICDYKSNNPDKTDSIKIRKKLKGIHFFMMESVTERKFVKPNSNEETIIATKVSGFQNPSFASLATDFQPFSFYKDNIKLFDINYLNPISKGSLNKYKFHIEDTIRNEKDTVYILSFKPKKGKNFDGLKGLLYINTNNYAVQNVIASPFEKGKIDIQIQQRYILIDEKYWFPEQLNFSLIFNELPNKKTPIKLDGKSYLTNIKVGIALDRKKFALEEVRIADGATTKDSVFWREHRIEKLNATELKTYTIIDSLGKKYKADSYLSAVEKIGQGRIPLNYVDIDLSKTFVYNKYESVRIGSGFLTSDKISKKINVGGFLGYGTRDKAFKYGGEFIFTISQKNDFNIGFKYQNNLVETGNYGLRSSEEDLLNYRKFIGYQYDQIKQNTLRLGFRSFRYLTWDLSCSQTKVEPKYGYVFDNTKQAYTKYNNSSIDLNLRFAYKEKFVNLFHQRMSMGTDYPIVLLSFSKGLKAIFNGNFNYTKIETSIEQSFHTRSLGTSKYRIECGYIDNALPYGLLFTGEGSYDKETPFIMKNTFQTMKPYEFLSDTYASMFFSQGFGGLLFKSGKFQPSISLNNNIGWGRLSNPDFHKSIEFKTKEKVYLETGLQFDNLIKMNYLNIANLGFGFAGYYRYGAYATPGFKDNIALKFTLNITVK